MLTTRGLERPRSTFLASFLCGAAGIAAAACGFSSAADQGKSGGTAGASTTSGSTTTSGSGTTSATTTSGSGGATGSTTSSTTGAGGSAGTGSGTGGTGGTGVVVMPAFKNYELTQNWPELKAAIATKPGTLTYTKITVHTRFLAESCSIADYNNDGNPDISSGRRWWEGPAFTTEHIFRGGHDDLPRNGDAPELVSGVSDDWADYPWDVDGDGLVDIINIASSDADTPIMPNPMPQTHATGYWYKNPGAGVAGMWASHLIHGDMRHEHHGLGDVDGDGKPEIYGACKDCSPAQTKGYYQANWANPTAAWTYHAVTVMYTFPFGGTGWMHGLGFGDVNGDGKPDLLERGGVWLQQPGGTWNATVCPAAGCGWVRTPLYDGDPADNRGGSNMFAFDVDGDGDADIIAADWAHGWGLAWYEQTTPNVFVKHPFLGTNSAADTTRFGLAGFSEPHSLQVVDMDGDGVPDIVTGKMRFAHPLNQGDPDPQGVPYLYVFKIVRNAPSVAGSVTFEPHMIDNVVGVGRETAIGHTNTDGIMDICIASKLGLFVFQGK